MNRLAHERHAQLSGCTSGHPVHDPMAVRTQGLRVLGRVVVVVLITVMSIKLAAGARIAAALAHRARRQAAAVTAVLARELRRDDAAPALALTPIGPHVRPAARLDAHRATDRADRPTAILVDRREAVERAAV